MTTTATPTTLDWRKSRAEALDHEPARRTVEVETIELRADGSNPAVLHLRGYASVTESPYDMGFYTETVARGAFKKTLSNSPDVVLNIGHGTNASGLPIARTKAGTLRLEEDSKGLKVDADLDPEDPDVQLLKRKMDRGDLDGQMSFAFSAPRSEWNKDYTERRITEANIHRGDVSIVTQGANPATSSSIRSLAAARERLAFDRVSLEYDDRIRALKIKAHSVAVSASTVGEYERRISAQRWNVVRLSLRAGGDKAACPRCKGKKTVSPNGVAIKCPLCLGTGTDPAADDQGEMVSYYGGRLRRAAKYTQKQIDALGRAGKAFRNPDGHYSFPVNDAEDLDDAIKAVGRSGASHNAVRRFIIKRARALGLSSKIPKNWAYDGSITK